MRRALHLKLFGVTAAAALLLSACGGGGISNNASSGSGKSCGAFNIAVNPWTGRAVTRTRAYNPWTGAGWGGTKVNPWLGRPPGFGPGFHRW